MKQLIKISKKYQIPIFEDDCYADLLFEKERPPAIKSFDKEGYELIVDLFLNQLHLHLELDI